MKDLIVRRAASAFQSKDYELAIELYQEATKSLGKDLFRANIIICQARLKKPANSAYAATGLPNKNDIVLTKYPTRRRISVSPSEMVNAVANVRISNGNRKSGIALIRFYDAQNVAINKDEVKLPHSNLFDSNYVYLKDSQSIAKSIFQTQVPKKAVELEIDFRLFEPEANTSIQVKDLNFEIFRTQSKFEKNQRPKNASEFKVAIIADEFTTNSFESEFIPIPIEPDNWQELFEEHQPDIFFCESAWSGADSKRRPWKGRVYASKNFANENRTELLAILQYCKLNNIPTVFWNKEDPTHHDDRIHDFVKTAQEFDFVFTTAAECIDSYRNKYKIKNVFALPFGTNPKLFNPIETKIRSNSVVFAGSWYANHIKRSQDMSLILDRITNDGLKLEIYDRYFGETDSLHAWPDAYKEFLLPSKPHNEMPEVYKSGIFGLNFNTVTTSPTMFARRVFELMSSNTLVISNDSLGTREMFGNLIIYPDKEPDRLRSITRNEINEIRQKALTLVLRHHTYTERWYSILEKIGIPFTKQSHTLTFVAKISSRTDALQSIAWFQQHGTSLEGAKLLLVVDQHIADLDTAKFYKEFNRFGVTVTSYSHAARYAIANKFQPIETTHFIELASNLNTAKLNDSLLHLKYIREYPIVLSEDTSRKYKILPIGAEKTVVYPATDIRSWLTGTAKNTIGYHV